MQGKGFETLRELLYIQFEPLVSVPRMKNHFNPLFISL
jgi:hypothetical protein